MLAAMKSRIHDVSGQLRRGLRLRVGRRDRPGRYGVLISSWTTREKFAATRSSGVAARVRGLGEARDRYRVYYGPMVEFGHRQRGGGRTPEHPFMRPAFDALEASAAELIEQQLVGALNEAF